MLSFDLCIRKVVKARMAERKVDGGGGGGGGQAGYCRLQTVGLSCIVVGTCNVER